VDILAAAKINDEITSDEQTIQPNCGNKMSKKNKKKNNKERRNDDKSEGIFKFY